MSAPACRFCRAPLDRVFVDLGMSPLSNAYLREEDLLRMEPFYPLKVFVCDRCLLVQLPEFVPPETLFADYAYFSSMSETWLAHCRAYADRMIGELGLGSRSLVVEVASNDGYLLRFFRERGIPVLGIEPAANVAAAAQAAGIPTRVRFFGAEAADELAAEGLRADLLIGNNVLAHVPDLNDFVEGLRRALKPGGRLTMEFPHLEKLVADCQFDTIYHEHFSYFSLGAAGRAFEAHGLRVFDVDELPTHGGSLRVHVRAADRAQPGPAVARILKREAAAGLDTLAGYAGFGGRVARAKHELLDFLLRARREGRRVAGYGAAAKGNTLLNACGIREDLLEFVADRSPHKQGRFLPGSHIPIVPPERIMETRPDDVLILPWNLRGEIAGQMSGIREWGGRFVTPIPALEVLP